MATKKDYVVCAVAISDAWNKAATDYLMASHVAIARSAILDVQDNLAAAFKAENPLFDKELFVVACNTWPDARSLSAPGDDGRLLGLAFTKKGGNEPTLYYSGIAGRGMSQSKTATYFGYDRTSAAKELAMLKERGIAPEGYDCTFIREE